MPQLYPIVSASCSDHRQWLSGYIDSVGSLVIPPKYAACNHFFEGKAAVMNPAGQSGFIDHLAQLVIPFQFKGLGRFHGGLCSINGGYIDPGGSWVIQPRFLVNSPFSEGLAFASTDGENFGFIDLAGKWVIHPQFTPCKQFSEGLAAVNSEGNWGYIERDGTFAIPAVFEGRYATSFRDGLAGVQIDGQWGFIDCLGRFVIQPQYDEIRPFSEGTACVRKNGKWGRIDRDGRTILEARFNHLGNQNVGMAPAAIEDEAGFISLDGNWTIDPVFDRCHQFFGDLAVVQRGSRFSYIRRSGEIVWTSEEEAPIQYPPPPIFI